MRHILALLTCVALVAAQDVSFEPVAATPTTRTIVAPVQREFNPRPLTEEEDRAVDAYVAYYGPKVGTDRDVLAESIRFLVGMGQSHCPLTRLPNDYLGDYQIFTQMGVDWKVRFKLETAEPLPQFNGTPPCGKLPLSQPGAVPEITGVCPTGGPVFQPFEVNVWKLRITTGSCRLECWTPPCVQPCKPQSAPCRYEVTNPGIRLPGQTGSERGFYTAFGAWFTPDVAPPTTCPPRPIGPPQPPPPPVFPGNCAPLVPGAPGTVTTGGITNPVQPLPGAAGPPL